jgi:hypothetical protein
MSSYATVWAWESGATGNDLLVLLRLADAAGQPGDDYAGAGEAVPTMARRTGLSTRTVQRCLRSLEAADIIRCTGQHAWAAGKVTNIYRLAGPAGWGDSLTPPTIGDTQPITTLGNDPGNTANAGGGSGVKNDAAPKSDDDQVPEDFPEALRPHARAAMRVLLDLAERKGAKRPTARSLGLVMMARPTHPLVRAAHDYAAWADAPSKRPRDVVAGYRNWLDKCDPLASTEPLPGQQPVHQPGSNVTRLRPQNERQERQQRRLAIAQGDVIGSLSVPESLGGPDEK